MVQLKDVDCAFGARALFSDVNLTIGERARIGLVGANGTGKTTLFRMLSGERSPDGGVLEMPRDLRIGYLPQEEIVLAEESVFDSAVAAFDHVHEIRAKMHELEERMKDRTLGEKALVKILTRYSHLQESYAQDGYTFEARTGEILQGLGFREKDFSRPCREFSGGYQMRIALARLLLVEPDLLLLDEPTNHLDLPSIEWLEGFIRGFKGSLVISSHDRYFLDRVVDTIWDTDYGTISAYKGSYTKFRTQKEARKAEIEKQIVKIHETRQHLQRFVDRFRGYPKKAALVRSRKKMLERLPDVRLPEEQGKVMHLRFPEAPRIAGRVVALEDVSKSFGNQVVFGGVNLAVEPGDRIALVGANGEGKTTLLRIIAGELEPSSGKVWESGKLLKAFYTQIVEDNLHPEDTVLGELESVAPAEPIPVLRTIAGMFLFPGDDADKKVAVLSGGEKSRLALAKIILTPCNLLLLDEPTNHLDLRAREVLEQAIRNYPGTVVFSAHDRFLIDRIANKVVEIKAAKAVLHLGNWSDFESWRTHWQESQKPQPGIKKPPEDAAVPAPRRQPSSPSSAPSPPGAPRERTSQAAKKARLERLKEEETNRAFAEIESREKEISVIEKELSDPKLYEDIERMRKVASRHRQLKEELQRLHEQLEGLLDA